MILIQPGNPIFLSERPFAGGLGASLYAAVDDGRGAVSIPYRPGQLSGPPTLHSGAVDLRKTRRLAAVKSPTPEILFPIPAEWHGKTVWVNPRTHAEDFENRTLYRPRRIVIDAEGNIATPVMATATVIDLEKRDGGGLLLRFAYNVSRDGAMPISFVLTKLTGSGAISPGTTEFAFGQRIYEIEVSGLTNNVAYTFTLSAQTVAGSTDLITGIAFTGDSAGPPAVTATVEEW